MRQKMARSESDSLRAASAPLIRRFLVREVRQQRETMCYFTGRMTEIETLPFLSRLIYSALHPASP